MIRTFLKNSHKWNDITRVNEDTGEVLIYSQDAELGFRFDDYKTTVDDMGFASAKAFCKHLKSRGKHEVDTQTQDESEVTGLLNLARYRKDHGRRFDDIPERLTVYGIALDEAIRMTNRA